MDFKSKYADVYTKWCMDDEEEWRHDCVKECHRELMQYISKHLTKPSCCHDVDKAILDIMDKHQKGSAKAYQAMFVGLLINVMDAKARDEFGQRPCWVLTHAWKSRALSFFMAMLLEEEIMQHFIELYHDETAKTDVLDWLK